MNPLDFDVLQTARHWVAAGHVTYLVSVMQTWGSAPRQAGALLALRADGQILGSVSGGCIENDLIERARAGQLGTKACSLTYGVTRDEATRFGLPCGGTLQLLIEPLTEPGWLDAVLTEIRAHRLIRRRYDLRTGHFSLHPAIPADLTGPDGEIFQQVWGPRWRLLIIGANQTARVLCDIAGSLDFHVIVCEPREEIAAGWDAPHASLVHSMPDDTVLEISTDERTAIVALTHDPKLDDMALLEALKSRAFYVGALGSRASQARRRERLGLFDLSAEQIARLRGPVGLPIASRTPAEIAVAIAAELIWVRNAAGAAGAWPARA